MGTALAQTRERQMEAVTHMGSMRVAPAMGLAGEHMGMGSLAGHRMGTDLTIHSHDVDVHSVLGNHPESGARHFEHRKAGTHLPGCSLMRMLDP